MVFVCLWFVFLMCPFLSRFLVERIVSTIMQPVERENWPKHCSSWLWYLCWCGSLLQYGSYRIQHFIFLLAMFLSIFIPLSSLCFMQTPLSILFYMQLECQNIKELSFHSFDVSQDELRLFPLNPCDYQGYLLPCNFVIRLNWKYKIKVGFFKRRNMVKRVH